MEETSLNETKAPRHLFIPPQQCLLPFRGSSSLAGKDAPGLAERGLRPAVPGSAPGPGPDPRPPAPSPLHTAATGNAGRVRPAAVRCRSEPRAPPLTPCSPPLAPRPPPGPAHVTAPAPPLKGEHRAAIERPNRAQTAPSLPSTDTAARCWEEGWSTSP